MTTGMASAATFNFQKSDPADVTNADFDIISFGASENGNKVTFWMQVRGNINEHPQDGYINDYEISIENIEMTATWVNSSGMITPYIFISTESGSYSALSPGQYIISSGKLEFHIDSSYFNDIGEDYTVDVYTAHVQGSNPTTSAHLDEATYSHYSSSGGGSSGNSSPGFPVDLLLWFLIGIIILVVVIVLVVILVVHKSTPPSQPPQQPPQPPQPPTQPPWEE